VSGYVIHIHDHKRNVHKPHGNFFCWTSTRVRRRRRRGGIYAWRLVAICLDSAYRDRIDDVVCLDFASPNIKDVARTSFSSWLLVLRPQSLPISRRGLSMISSMPVTALRTLFVRLRCSMFTSTSLSLSGMGAG
jgi:hypothetical protein